MGALTAYLNQADNAITAHDVQEVSASMINDFIAFIDRGERTTQTYITNLRQFVAWMHYKSIQQPKREDVISYREWLASEHQAIALAPESAKGWAYRTGRNGQTITLRCKPNTIKIYLQSVKQFFAWASANGRYANIAANIHAPKTSASHKKDSLSILDVRAIESSITSKAEQRRADAAESAKDTRGRIQRTTEQGKRLYAMYLLAVNAGLRTIELSRANVKDIETKGGKHYMYIWGKGHTEPDQKKPLAPEVVAALNDYLESRTDNPTGYSPLFVAAGNRSKGKRIASTTISTMLKRAMQEAGFDSDRLTAHSLRHTTAQNVMDLTGSNIYLAQQYLRHASPATTEIYLDNTVTDKEEVIAEQLYRRFHGEEPESDTMQKLQGILATMRPEQLEQLTGIAAAITK